MNPILLFEQRYISFVELETVLWDMGPNAINEIGESCFIFYCSNANRFNEYSFYIRKCGSDSNEESEWYCE